MSYDEGLAQRVYRILRRRPKLSQRKMFGGIAFMLNGNMCCGVLNDELMVRVMPDEYDAAMKRPHTRAFDFTGKPMRGFVVVLSKGYRGDKALKGWIDMGVKCARPKPRKRDLEKNDVTKMQISIDQNPKQIPRGRRQLTFDGATLGSKP